MNTQDALDLAASIAGRAVAAGADAAEVYIARSRELEVMVREGRLERTVEERHAGCGLRIDIGLRQGCGSTTDLSPAGVRALIDLCLAAGRAAPEDPAALLPHSPPTPGPASDLFDPALEVFDFDRALQIALRTEEAALLSDRRVRSGEGSSFAQAVGEIAIASTLGAAASYSGTRCLITCAPVAEAGGERQRQPWHDSRRFLGDLPEPEEIGRTAALRAVRMLGARRIAARRTAVVIDPLEAARFWSGLAPAALGDSARRGISFLGSDLGRAVASEAVTLVDDPTVPRAPGSRPFDGEGWPTSRRPIIDRGILKGFLYDTRSARRAGAATTGNAVRPYSSPPAPGAHAPALEAGRHSPGDLLAAAGSGLYVTNLIGSGTNLANGHYSRGANGLWFERGEFAFPVHEVTLAGNLRDLLLGIAMVGNDHVRRSAASSPTFLIEGIVVSGGPSGD